MVNSRIHDPQAIFGQGSPPGEEEEEEEEDGEGVVRTHGSPNLTEQQGSGSEDQPQLPGRNGHPTVPW